MNLVGNATILRFREGATDKVWVICPGAGAHGDNLVAWGATRWSGNATPTLQSKSVSGSADSRIRKKLKEGYCEWNWVQFDSDDLRVVHIETKPIPTPEPCFWYRIDQALFPQEVTSILDSISNGLAEVETELSLSGLVKEFHSLSLVMDLQDGQNTGQLFYREPRMSVLVLFALHRAHPLLAHTSDDNNDLLPDQLNDLRSLLSDEARFGPLPEYCHPPVFKRIAAAMQCIDLSSDLSRIKTETPAAFF